VTDPETCTYDVEHYVKFEACLTWPDGATRTAFGLETRVRLYRKADVQPVVDARADAERPLTWTDLEQECPGKQVAEGRIDTASGYLYFSEEGSGEEEGVGQLEYQEISAWPTGEAERFYLAVEGCAVLLPLWRVETLASGVPQKFSTNSYADGYLIDAAQPTCLLELELQETEVDGTVVLVWKSEVAFARRSGAVHSKDGAPHFRALMDASWSHGSHGPWPGEEFSRQSPVLTVQVLPLAVAKAEPAADPAVCDARSTSDPSWDAHPSQAFTPHAHVLDMFNLPATRPQLEWGLNVDAQGRPDRVQMVPGAVLDLTQCAAASRTGVLDHVWVRFFEFGLRAGGDTYANITLRTLAFNRIDAEQVPFGDAVCFDGGGDTRIKTFSAAGFDVISPIMPQYTCNVHASEQFYDPLAWVSGGTLTSAGLLVDCSLRSGAYGRRGGKSWSVQTAYQNGVAHHSWAPNVDAVRKLYYYHRDYFRKGGTAGVYSSSRGGDAHDHKGIDLYGFCHGGFNTSSTELQGEAMYAMRRCRARLRKSGPDDKGRMLYYYYLTFKPDGSWRQIDYMHAYKTPGPATAHMSKSEAKHFHMVWAGAFLGWSGSSGNANGPGVSSKHLHMYFSKKVSSSVPGRGGTKTDPADLFKSGTSVSSNATHRRKNHFPWIKGKVTNSHDRTFKAKQVKLIAYDRALSSPLTTTDVSQTEILAITTVRDNGTFELYIPPDRDVTLLVTRAYCDVVNVEGTSDVVDHEQDLRYAPDGKYNATGENLGTIKLEYAQHITGRVVGADGSPVSGQAIDVVEVATTQTVGRIKSGEDGAFTAMAPAGLVKLKIGAKTHEIPARTAGTHHDAGDLAK
jgi:hypothetical protein